MYSSSYTRLSKGIALEAKTPWRLKRIVMQVSAAGPRFTATPAYFLGCLIFVSIVVLCCLRCAPILCTRCCGHQIYNFGSTYKGKIKASRLYLESPAVNLELSSWIRSRPIGSTRIFTVCRERDPRLLFCCETNQKQERETPKDREVLVRFKFLQGTVLFIYFDIRRLFHLKPVTCIR
jgi:hypothetical protein